MEATLLNRAERQKADYEAFQAKFKNKNSQKNSDDCYTPFEVYQAVENYVLDYYADKLEGAKVIRPFYPGGNYEDLSQYPENCVVIDNPPFSLTSKICKFYNLHKIRFFLFCQGKTLGSVCRYPNTTGVLVKKSIEYHNGVRIRTCFLTNMDGDILIRSAPELNEALVKLSKKREELNKALDYPRNVTSAALLLKYSHAKFEIRRDQAKVVESLQAQKHSGKAVFGYGFFISDEVADKLEAIYNEAHPVYELSRDEKEIIAHLNGKPSGLFKDLK